MFTKNTVNMTKGKPFRLLANFAFPIILSSIFQLLYTVADSAVVGRLIGVDAFAAVGAAGFYHWMALSIVFGMTHGFGAILAQRFGAGDLSGLRRSFQAGVALSALFGAVLSVMGVALARPLLALLNTPPEILETAVRYVQVLLAGMIVSFLLNMFAATLRGLGNSRTPMTAVVFSSLLNIGLDVAAVELLHWGVEGVATATVASQVAACAICLHRIASIEALHSGEANKIKRFSFRTPEAMALLRMGGPMALRDFIIAIGGLAMQYVVNGFGSVFIAGIAAAWKLYGMLEIAGGGYEGAAATFVAQNFGAGKLDRVSAGMKSAVRTLLIASVCIAGLTFLFGRSVLGLLVGGDTAGAVLDIGKNQLNMMSLALPSLYMLFLFRAGLQGMGNATGPMISGFIELTMRIVCIAVLPLFWGEWGVYIAEIAGWPAAALQLVICYKIFYKKHL